MGLPTKKDSVRVGHWANPRVEDDVDICFGPGEAVELGTPGPFEVVVLGVTPDHEIREEEHQISTTTGQRWIWTETDQRMPVLPLPFEDLLERKMKSH